MRYIADEPTVCAIAGSPTVKHPAIALTNAPWNTARRPGSRRRRRPRSRSRPAASGTSTWRIADITTSTGAAYDTTLNANTGVGPTAVYMPPPITIPARYAPERTRVRRPFNSGIRPGAASIRVTTAPDGEITPTTRPTTSCHTRRFTAVSEPVADATNGINPAKARLTPPAA